MVENSPFLNLFRHKESTPYVAGQTVIEAAIRVGGKEVEVSGPGSIFGEMALIDAGPRSAIVVARTNCRLAEVDRRRFEFMVWETPFFALAVIRIMADRLRKANGDAASA